MSGIQLRKTARLVLPVLLFSPVLVLVFIGVYAVYEFVFTPLNPPADFCTLKDVVYESMNQNAEKWMEVFRSDKTKATSSLPFPSLKDNESILVNIAGLGDDAWQEVLFVVTQHGWNERMGLSGYIYSPLGKPDLSDKYQTEYIQNHIYCYTRKSQN